MVTKTTKLVNLGFLCFSLSACSIFRTSSMPRSDKPYFAVNWVKPTYDEAFIAHRKMNRMTPIVTDELVILGSLAKRV